MISYINVDFTTYFSDSDPLVFLPPTLRIPAPIHKSISSWRVIRVVSAPMPKYRQMLTLCHLSILYAVNLLRHQTLNFHFKQVNNQKFTHSNQFLISTHWVYHFPRNRLIILHSFTYGCISSNMYVSQNSVPLVCWTVGSETRSVSCWYVHSCIGIFVPEVACMPSSRVCVRECMWVCVSEREGKKGNS